MNDLHLFCHGIGPGSTVATRRGEVPVQLLSPSDEVIALRAARLRRVAAAQMGHCDDAVRVAADAFGPGRPQRDLLLGAEALMLVPDPDGSHALVPARRLVNGATIVPVTGTGHEFWSVSLFEAGLDSSSAADAVLVEGVPICTAGIAADPPSRSAVAEARRQAIAQAASLGWRRSSDVDFHVAVEGRRLSPASRQGSTLTFDLIEGNGVVALRSIGATPREVEPDSDDTRLLGVAISRLALDGEVIDLDDERLVRGFYGVEREEHEGEIVRRWRWTDGDARLQLGRAGRLDVTVHLIMKPWAGPRDHVARPAPASLPPEPNPAGERSELADPVSA